MDGLVWFGLVSTIAGAGFLAFGLRSRPAAAVGVPAGMGVLAVVLLVVILSRSPASRPTEMENPLPKPLPLASNETEPLAGPVDLLQKIDPARHRLSGFWTRKNRALISSLDRPAKLVVPAGLPERYQVTAVVERLEGIDSFSFGVAVGGRDVMVCLDGYDGIYSGLNLIDGSTADRNESRRRGPFLANGKPNTLVVRVEPGSLRATVNGQVAIDWRGDPNRLSLDRRWPNGPPGHLQIATWNTRYRVTKLELMPLPES